MIKNKYIGLTILLSLFNITTVYASCTKEELNEFKKVEDQYKVIYEYNRTTKTYDMYFRKDSEKKFNYKVYSSKEFTCDESNNNVIKCSGFPLEPYDIEIYSTSETCTDVLKTISFDLSHYNEYFDDPLCEGIEEFVLCSPTYEKEIEYETFVSRVETYKRTKEKKEHDEIEKIEDKKNMFDDVYDYIKNNLYTLIISIIFVILVIVTIILSIRSTRKSRRLE